MTRFRLPFLIAGATVGLLVAAFGMVDSRRGDSSELPPGTIARVGDTLISESRYVAVLDDLSTDKRNSLTDADREFALQRLIDEELLIQRGIELGLAENAPAVRKAVAAEVISHVVTTTRAARPDEAILREFYDSVAMYFSTPGRLRLRWWRQTERGSENTVSALQLERQLRDANDPAVLFDRYGFERVTDLPESLLPTNKLLDYIGPALLEHVSSVQPGQFASPIEDEQGLHVFFLVEQLAESTPSFEAVRDAVEQEYRYRAGDAALREYIDWLRSRTLVTVSDPVTQ
jgi:hypothetical protein